MGTFTSTFGSTGNEAARAAAQEEQRRRAEEKQKRRQQRGAAATEEEKSRRSKELDQQQRGRLRIGLGSPSISPQQTRLSQPTVGRTRLRI